MICAQIDCRREGANRIITTEVISKPMGQFETKYYSYYLCDADAQRPLSERHVKEGSLVDIDYEKDLVVKSVETETEQHETENLVEETHAG